jgi:C1A family cysteine protease
MINQTGLGRLRSKSPDIHNYLLERQPEAAKGVVRRHWIAPGVVLDQGDTSQCVIYACDKYLTSFPVRNKGFLSPKQRERIYKIVQTLDEWRGEAYDGTSVHAMFRWLHDQGFVAEYRWGFDCETVINHVLGTGPVEMGTNWDAGMSNPDRHGYIALNKDDIDDEGHAWTIIGADRERRNPDHTVGAVRMINSWGPTWGQGGRAWITFDNLDKLIKLQGEAAVATEIKVAGMDLTSVGNGTMVA